MATPAWFEVAPDDVQERLQALIAEHYVHTYSEQRVTAVMRNAAHNDKGESQDWQTGGARILGKWVKVPERFKCLMAEPPETVVLLNAEAWNDELSEEQRTALLDHELYHGVQRAHDIGEFSAILERRGDYLEHIAPALSPDADLPLRDPETGAPVEHDAAAGEVRRAVKRLRDGVSLGTSVTITAGDKSVTLGEPEKQHAPDLEISVGGKRARIGGGPGTVDEDQA